MVRLWLLPTVLGLAGPHASHIYTVCVPATNACRRGPWAVRCRSVAFHTACVAVSTQILASKQRRWFGLLYVSGGGAGEQQCPCLHRCVIRTWGVRRLSVRRDGGKGHLDLHWCPCPCGAPCLPHQQPEVVPVCPWLVLMPCVRVVPGQWSIILHLHRRGRTPA